MKEFDVQRAEESILAIQAQLDTLNAGGDPPEGMTVEEARLTFASHINAIRLLIAQAESSPG